MLPNGAKFCNECGHDLRKPADTQPIDLNQPQSYTPKHLADKILTTRSAIEGERKLVTVLFADVSDFTGLSEKLDPEQVHEIMDKCFKILMDEIHQHEGTINQFTGDGVMALFGAPVAHEDHAQRACHAALAIQRAVKAFGEKISGDYGIDFKMRIGLNSGPVIVGAIGDDLRMDYTAVGDTTNLASRMEGLARHGTVFISRNTRRLVQGYFDLKALEKVPVKGKEEPQEVFELLGAGGAVSRLEAAAAKGLTRFVGRKNAMAALMDAYEKVKGGTGMVVGVVGEAGVGKSRLLLEFRQRLPDGEFGYLEGRCIHFGSAIPYLPILDILKSYFEISEGESEPVIRKRVREKIMGLDEKLQDILPPIYDLLSLKVEDKIYLELDPRVKREKLFEALRNLIVRGSQERPLVLAIEDLHWIDKTTEEFLDYFIGWLATTRVMLILLYRPEYIHQWAGKSYFSRIGVDQLSLKSSAQLVKAILEGGETDPELSELILNRAAGNPLFMEELTHSLLENGAIEIKDQRYVLCRASTDLQVPDTVQGIISARLDRLEDNLKRTMQVASVIGRDFAFRILQTITGMREELKSYLLNLQGLEFIYEKNLFPELEYIFKHALTQEVAYNSLLLKRRKEIHEKIGQAIEGLYAERLEEFYEMLAFHYAKSENLSKACRYLKLSGDKARGNFSTSEAVRFYKEALDLLGDQPENQNTGQVRLEILQTMAYPLRALGYPEGSLECLEEGETLARALGDQRARASFQTQIGVHYLISGGDPKKGREYIERGLEGAELTEEVELIVPTTYELITSQMIEGDFSGACRLAPKVISLIEKTHTEHNPFGRPANIYSQLHGFYGVGLGAMGSFTEGEGQLDKGLSLARDLNNLISIAIIEMWYGILCLFKGDMERHIRHHLTSIEYLEKSQLRIFLGPVWAWLGAAYLFQGEINRALQCAEKGLKIHTELNIPFFIGSIHRCLCEIHLKLGNLENARVHGEQAVDLAKRNNERFMEAEARITLGRVIAARERTSLEEARGLVLQGITMLDELGIRPYYAIGLLYLAGLYVSESKEVAALEHLKRAEGMFQEMGMVYWLDKVQEALATL
ncbi:adenylate and Guanylate cyclase catalytic domain protein [delta proteobacterium NaphS2]|nr:adenylate and Guanylate cyclase catalytic domain protein [delta proteobacterium NaphS2]